jgi:hypothetical protein
MFYSEFFSSFKACLVLKYKNSYKNEKEKTQNKFGWKIICEKKIRRKLYKRTFYKNFTNG